MRKEKACVVFGGWAFFIAHLLTVFLVACQVQTAVPTPNLSLGEDVVVDDSWVDSLDGEIEWIDCPFETYDRKPLCGYLSVPIDYSQPDTGETFRLPFVQYKTSSTEPKSDPLVMMLPMMQAGFVTFLFDDLYQERDLVVLNMRGVDMAEPQLACPAMTTAMLDALPSGGLSSQEWKTFHEQCRQTLEAQQIALDTYNFSNMANDIKALRLALEYPEWNVFAFEPMDTYLAYEQLRIDSEGVRSLVLSSFLPQYTSHPHWYDSAQEVLQEVFALCSQDTQCNEAFPNLESIFYNVVDQLSDNAAKVETADLSLGRRTGVQVDGDLLVEIVLYAILNGRYENIGQLPRMIYQMRDGNYETLAQLTGSHFQGVDNTYDGFYYMMLCRYLPQPDDVQAGLSELPMGLVHYFERATEYDRAICSAWEPQADVLLSGASTVKPILLLNGSWNWRLGTSGVDKFKDLAPESQVVTFPMVGRYGLFSHNVMDCSQFIISAFIENPAMQVDRQCVPETQHITWITLH